MQAGNPLHNRQAQPASRLFLPRWAIKALPQSFQMLSRDARAVVLYRQLPLAERDRYRATGRSVTYRLVYQIAHQQR